MRRSALLLLALVAALPLGGCVVAAVPVIAGAAIARSEAQRDKRNEPAAVTPAPVPTPPPVAAANPRTIVTVGPPGTAASPVPADFTPLIDHVRSRATLWREGAPMKSLVLDDRQTVLNPMAIDCRQRQPAVLIDADPALPGPSPAITALLATPGWAGAVAAIRDLDVSIVWITARPETDAEAVRARLVQTGLDPMNRDRVGAVSSGSTSKQAVRLAEARRYCVLAVVGDKRGDADEAYDYLRSPDSVLPIDSNWGAGWFLMPAPLSPPDGTQAKEDVK